VVDAGVVIAVLAGTADPEGLVDDEVAVPHLVDSEVPNALRKAVVRGALTDVEAGAAMDGFVRLSLTRYPADWLRPRMWALRHNLSAYDATYVALAEVMTAPLLTTDRRLARAPGLLCPVRVVG
jgi:predicted nucleic acid-binding protein